MLNSYKLFAERSSYYYQRRRIYYKDWYWYLPEKVKVLIMMISVGGFLAALPLLDSLFHEGRYLLSFAVVTIWVMVGYSSSDDAFWIPERVTDELKYKVDGSALDFFNTRIASNHLISALYWIIAPVCTLLLRFCFPLAPLAIALFAMIGQFSSADGSYFALFLSFAAFTGIYSLVHGRHKGLRDRSMAQINAIKTQAKMRKTNNHFKDVEFDVDWLCKAKFDLELCVSWLTIILVELLLIRFI